MNRKTQTDFGANYRLELWAGSAVKLIKFKPDRERVKKELMDHMADARDAYIEAGFDLYEAESKAIENMGDAGEVADSLADIYRPFWGRLWKTTRFFAVLAVIYMVWSSFYMLTENGLRRYDFNTYFEPLYENAAERIIADISSPDKVRINGYTITIPRAVVVQSKAGDGKHIWFTVQLTNTNPYLQNPRIKDEICAKDDKGNVYTPRIMYEADSGYDLAGNPVFVSPFKTYYEMWLTGIDRDIQEITFYYDRFGEYFELKLPLGGEEND